MPKFVVTIVLKPLPMEKVQELAGPEDAMVAGWKQQGTVEVAYVLADFSGAYIAFQADTEAAVHEQMSKLPMFPYMEISIQEVRDMV